MLIVCTRFFPLFSKSAGADLHSRRSSICVFLYKLAQWGRRDSWRPSKLHLWPGNKACLVRSSKKWNKKGQNLKIRRCAAKCAEPRNSLAGSHCPFWAAFSSNRASASSHSIHVPRRAHVQLCGDAKNAHPSWPMKLQRRKPSCA